MHLQKVLTAPYSAVFRSGLGRLSLPACRWEHSTSHLLTGRDLTYSFKSNTGKPAFVMALNLVGEPSEYGAPIEIVDSMHNMFKASGKFQEVVIDGLKSSVATSSSNCIPIDGDALSKLPISTDSLVLCDIDFAQDELTPLYERIDWAHL